MGGTVARQVTVHGRVQGVFFRASTRRMAREHGVTGWVANRADGAVVTWLEGPAERVDAVERWIVAGGPAGAEVREAHVDPVTPEGHGRFAVRDNLPAP